jgi:hypothetical protein
MPDTADALIVMARNEIHDLTSTEESLFQKIAKGEIADFRLGVNSLNHPYNVGQWEAERRLRSECIAWICAKAKNADFLTRFGIRIKGAKIEGELHLDEMEVDVPLVFSHCVFTNKISLRNAKLRMLEFQLTHLGSIEADGLHVDGSIYLRNGFRTAGRINLYQAKIGGDLVCNYSHVLNEGLNALFADALEVKGSVVFRNSEFRGMVNLNRTQVTGNINFEGSQFINNKDDALSLQGANIGGSVHLNNYFKSRGRVNLYTAKIGSSLGCDAGHFAYTNCEERVALRADRSSIGGNVLLRNGFKSIGCVNFSGATIGGNLQCEGGQFMNEKRDVLSVQGAKIGGNVFLNKDFTSTGKGESICGDCWRRSRM